MATFARFRLGKFRAIIFLSSLLLLVFAAHKPSKAQDTMV